MSRHVGYDCFRKTFTWPPRMRRGCVGARAYRQRLSWLRGIMAPVCQNTSKHNRALEILSPRHAPRRITGARAVAASPAGTISSSPSLRPDRYTPLAPSSPRGSFHQSFTSYLFRKRNEAGLRRAPSST